MKKLVFLLAAVASVSLANAQKLSEKAVPEAVQSALQKNNPNAKEVKWEKEKGNYEAGFEVSKTDHSVLIDASGSIIETEVEISIDALPKNARTLSLPLNCTLPSCTVTPGKFCMLCKTEPPF